MNIEQLEQEINQILKTTDNNDFTISNNLPPEYKNIKNVDKNIKVICPKQEKDIKRNANISIKTEKINLDNIIPTDFNDTLVLINMKFCKNISFETDKFKDLTIFFINCTFEKKIAINKNSYKNYIFTECVFSDGNLFVGNKNELEKIEFQNCNCNYETSIVNIENLNIDTLKITNCENFVFNIEIKNCKITKLEIEDSTLNEFNIKSNSRIGQIKIKGSTFSNVDFEKSSFDSDLEFENCTFENQTNFKDISAKAIIFCNLDNKNLLKLMPQFTNLKNTEEIVFKSCIFETGFNIDVFNKIVEKTVIEFNYCKFNSSVYTNQNVKILPKFDFYSSIFNDKLDLSGTTFKNEINFFSCEFNKNVYLNDSTFQERVCFSDHSFVKNEKLKEPKNDLSTTIFNQNFEATNAKFNKNVLFKNAIFKNKVNFKNSTFQACDGGFYTANFSNVKFNNDLYFNNSIFNFYMDFHESQFDKVASFFSATFNDCMNFSGCVFNDFNKVNFINVNLNNLNLEKMRNILNKQLGDNSTQQHKVASKEKKKIINGLRDSFRIIKHFLFSINNSLEASRFHKLELYAKEIELECDLERYHGNFKSIESKNVVKNSRYNSKNYKKFQFKNILVIFYPFMLICKSFYKFIISFLFCLRIIFKIIFIILKMPMYMTCISLKAMFYSKSFKDFVVYIKQHFKKATYLSFVLYKTRKMLNLATFIDYLTLSIYRKTSNHHTNFTKILNFTIVMIALFGIVTFIIDTSFVSSINKTLFIDIYFCLILFSLAYIGFCYLKNESLISIFLILLSLSLLVIYEILFICKNFDGIATLFFVTLYLFCILIAIKLFSKTNNLVTFLLRFISYVIFGLMLVLSPASIVPFFNSNQTGDQKTIRDDLQSNANYKAIKEPTDANFLISINIIENNWLLDANKTISSDDTIKKDKILKSLNFVYMVIFALCLYSLQKTARRNSIIPT